MILHVLLGLLLLAARHLAFDSLGFKDKEKLPWFAEAAANKTVAVGRVAILPCVVDNIGDFKLAWIHKDRHNLLTLHDKVITRNPRVSISHSSYRSWSLQIEDVRLEDAGQYMCQINTSPMESQVTYLEVVVPPSIDEKSTSSDLEVREGADVKMSCSASGTPKPTIKWRREEDKGIILGSKRVPSVEGEQLKLTRTSRLSMGAYLCIASNGVLPAVSKRITLNVFFAPMILIPNQLIGANVDQDVSLVCNLESFPRSVTYWVIDKGVMLITNNKYRVVNEPADSPAPYKVKMVLHIRDLRPQDFGSYKCIAKNSLGETEGVIVLYENVDNIRSPADDDNERYSERKIELKEPSVSTYPIADNIKLGNPSPVSNTAAERKEALEDTDKEKKSFTSVNSDDHYQDKNSHGAFCATYYIFFFCNLAYLYCSYFIIEQ